MAMYEGMETVTAISVEQGLDELRKRHHNLTEQRNELRHMVMKQLEGECQKLQEECMKLQEVLHRLHGVDPGVPIGMMGNARPSY